jgi:replicative DNA helicase
MTDKIELIVLRNLLFNPDYTRKVLPFLREDYFHDSCEKRVFVQIEQFVQKYSAAPTVEALGIILSEQSGISQGEFDNCLEIVRGLTENKDQTNDQAWLVDETEKFCKDKAIYNALMESIQLLEDKKGNKTRNAIPEILSNALGVSFDTSVGHDFVQDSDKRFEFYHRTEERVPFDIDYLNQITNGGVPSKTLNVILAGTGVGKSLFMCHHAANCLSQNRNVLYITCEMAEERIAERIDANLMNITMDELKKLPKDVYDRKLSTATAGLTGKLIIKEYPTATANADHFRNLLRELRLKKDFKPDIVFIDYLNICTSSRFKSGNSNVNSYMYVKAIAEELRGLAVQMDFPIFTATQTTRSGFNNSEIELTDTSESFGLPATADLMIAIIATEELIELDQVMIKQLKNRYGDPTLHKKFVVGIDRAKMKLYDAASSQQSLFNKMSQPVKADVRGGGDMDDEDDVDSKFTIGKKRSFSEWKS